jgi:hypothetical protein
VSSLNFAWLQVGAAIGLCSLAFTACQYDIPITSGPTRKVQERLLGDWMSADGKEKLKLRSLDDSIYILTTTVLFFALTTPTSPKHLSQLFRTSTRAIASMLLSFWKLSDDGKNLRLRSVNDQVVLKETWDSATVVALLTKNARNPELFGEEIEFQKEK